MILHYYKSNFIKYSNLTRLSVFNRCLNNQVQFNGQYQFTHLSNRKLIRISGRDTFSYVQLMTTNDLQTVNKCISSFMVNENGKVLADMLIYRVEGDVFDKELKLSGINRKNYGKRFVNIKIPEKQKEQLKQINSNSSKTDYLLSTNFHLREMDEMNETDIPNKKEEQSDNKLELSSNIYTPDEVETLLIECDIKVAEALTKTFTARSIREKIHIELLPDFHVFSVFPQLDTYKNLPSYYSPREEYISKHVIMMQDPRLSHLGYRFLTSFTPDPKQVQTYLQQWFNEKELQMVKMHDYQLHRFHLGVPEGFADFDHAKSFCLETNADYLNGVSFEKGNFLGQMPSQRVYKRQYLRNRLLPFELVNETKGETPLPKYSEFEYKGKSIGWVINARGKFGLGVFQLETLRKMLFNSRKGKFINLRTEGDSLPILTHSYSGAKIKVTFPDWWPEKNQYYTLPMRTYVEQMDEQLSLAQKNGSLKQIT